MKRPKSNPADWRLEYPQGWNLEHLIVGSRGLLDLRGGLVPDCYHLSNRSEMEKLGQMISGIMEGRLTRVLYSTTSEAMKRTAEIVSSKLNVQEGNFRACEILDIPPEQWDLSHYEGKRVKKLDDISNLIEENSDVPGMLFIVDGYLKDPILRYYVWKKGIAVKDEGDTHLLRGVNKNMYRALDFAKKRMYVLSGKDPHYNI